MFFLGILDMISIAVDAILCGLQMIQGEHFCARPLYYYCVGAIAMGLYHAVTAICCVLALDRFLSMLFPKIGNMLFHGYRTYFWNFLSLLYMFLFFVWQTPVVYLPHGQKMSFDPYKYTEFEGNPNFYDHPMIFINSFLVVFIMGPLYVILCIVLYLKKSSLLSASKIQKIMFLQSFAICFEMFFVAIVYVANSWVELPEFLTKYEHMVLIFVHGDTPIVYLMLNGTLRRQVYENVKEYLVKGAKKVRRQVVGSNSYYTNQRVHPNLSMISGMNSDTQRRSLAYSRPNSQLSCL
uniref:Uncharacterized protein n=1 Tax=Acrobeloides nanus TaxID=290746 RepID=A0A914E8M8_9BILA